MTKHHQNTKSLTRKEKNKLKFIEEVHNETWKTIHTELSINPIWDESLDGFLCYTSNSKETYFCEYNDFFKKHVIESNKGKWGRGNKTRKELDEKNIASWLCLINGHNFFQDNLEIFLEKHPDKENEIKNEGNNLLEYIFDRYEDAIFSLKNETIPTWLLDYIKNDVEILKEETNKTFQFN